MDIFCQCYCRNTVIIRGFDVIFPTLWLRQVDGLCEDTSGCRRIGDKELAIVILSTQSSINCDRIADVRPLLALALHKMLSEGYRPIVLRDSNIEDV